MIKKQEILDSNRGNYKVVHIIALLRELHAQHFCVWMIHTAGKSNRGKDVCHVCSVCSYGKENKTQSFPFEKPIKPFNYNY